MSTTQFGRVLVELRHQRGLSQYALTTRIAASADAVGLTRAAITHFESGRRMPLFLQMRTLADALGASAAEIRRMIDAAGVDDVRYLTFSLANRAQDDAAFLVAWEEFVATVSKPIVTETV